MSLPWLFDILMGFYKVFSCSYDVISREIKYFFPKIEPENMGFACMQG